MAKRFLQIGRPQAGRHFQADRYGFGERKRQRARAWGVRASIWWAGATPTDRLLRILGWSVFAVAGAYVGVMVAIVATALI